MSEMELLNLPTKELNSYCQKIARLYYDKTQKPFVPIGTLIRGFFRYFSFFNVDFICQVTTKEILLKEIKGKRILIVRGMLDFNKFLKNLLYSEYG